jgi:hypothetical protein
VSGTDSRFVAVKLLVMMVIVLCFVPTVTYTQSSGVAGAAGDRGAICVIDDSADMGDKGRDGFSITPEKNWPIMSYLTPFLGCHQCCTWSAFRANGARCGVPCTAKVPPLKLLSPLIETLENAVVGARGGNIFFVTNGLDWRTEGQDHFFRVEMDAGEILADWVKSRPSSSVVLGVAQDNRGRSRRQNLLLGLISRPSSSTSCESAPSNVPKDFQIRSQEFLNPEGWLDNGVFDIYPTVQVVGSVGAKSVSQAFEVSADGLVRLPLERMVAIEKPQLKITFKSQKRALLCWGIVAESSSGERLPAVCDTSGKSSAMCALSLPPFKDWPTGGVRLALKTSPTTPNWAVAAVPDPQHAFRRTLKTFESVATVSRRFRVTRTSSQGTQSCNWLTLVLVPSHR